MAVQILPSFLSVLINTTKPCFRRTMIKTDMHGKQLLAGKLHTLQNFSPWENG